MSRAVLFDLDGTLVDSSELHVRACDYALRMLLDVTASRADLLTGMGMRLVDFFARWAPDQTDALRDAAVGYYQGHHTEYIRTYPGVDAMLQAVQRWGLPMAIVSSKPRCSIDLDLDALGLDAYFRVRIAAEDVRRAKPDPEGLLQALVALHVQPECALVVGDHPNDVRAARAAGMRVAGALWDPLHREALRAAQPDFLLETPPDLLRVLDRARHTR